GPEPGASAFDDDGDPEPLDDVPSNLTVVLQDGDIEHLGAGEVAGDSEPPAERAPPARAKTVPPPAPVPRRRAETSMPPPTPSPASSPLPGVSAIEPARFDLEVPTALVRYLETAAAITPQQRFEALKEDLERAGDDQVAGELAYELGEVAMHELGDEASAVKAYGRALQIDPSLRANLWAIRRIFYRRALWPNL